MQLGRNDQYDVFAIEPKRLQQCSVERFDRSRERVPTRNRHRGASPGDDRARNALLARSPIFTTSNGSPSECNAARLSSRDDSDELISRRGNGHDVPIAEHLGELLQVRQRGRALGWAGCLQPFGSHRLFEGGLPMPQLCGRFARELGTPQIAGDGSQAGEIRCGRGIGRRKRRPSDPAGEAGTLHPAEGAQRLGLECGHSARQLHDRSGLGLDRHTGIAGTSKMSCRLQRVERLSQLVSRSGEVASRQPHRRRRMPTGKTLL